MLVDNPALNVGSGILVHRVMVDDTAINASPAEVKSLAISFAANKHDQAVLTTKLTKSQAKEFLNQTVSITYGPTVKRDTFRGYIEVIRPSRKYQEDLIYDIVCLGVTQPMQTGETRFWTDRTAPSVASEVVLAHKLGFMSEGHGFVWPSLSQTGDSDWEVVTKAAALCGFVVVVTDGVVRLVDAEHQLRSAAPIVHLVKGDQVLDSGRELLDFTPEEESTSLRKNTRPSYAFFDRNAGVGTTPREEEGDTQYRYVTSYPVSSREMADVLISAWERSTEFWVESAKARTRGNARIKPGDLVAISLGTSSVIVNENDGLWFVVGVTHNLTHNSFQTELVLARDKVRKPSNTEYKDFYSNVQYGRPKVLVDSSGPSKKWKSSWPQAIIRPTRVDVPQAVFASTPLSTPWVG